MISAGKGGSYAMMHQRASSSSGFQSLQPIRADIKSSSYGQSLSPTSPRRYAVSTSADAALAAFDSADEELESMSEFKPYTSSSPVQRQHQYQPTQQSRYLPLQQVQQLQQQQQQASYFNQSRAQIVAQNFADNQRLEESIMRMHAEALQDAKKKVIPSVPSVISTSSMLAPSLSRQQSSLSQSSLQRLATPKAIPIYNSAPTSSLPKFDSLKKNVVTSDLSSKLENSRMIKRSTSDSNSTSPVLMQTWSPSQPPPPQQQPQQQSTFQRSLVRSMNKQPYQSYENHNQESYDLEKNKSRYQESASLLREREVSEMKASPSSPTSRDNAKALQSQTSASANATEVRKSRVIERPRRRLSEDDPIVPADTRTTQEKKRAETEMRDAALIAKKKAADAAMISELKRIAEAAELRKQAELKRKKERAEQLLAQQALEQKELLAAEKAKKDAKSAAAAAAAAAGSASLNTISDKVLRSQKTNSANEASLETITHSRAPLAPPLLSSSSFSSSTSLSVSTPIVSTPRGLVGLQNLGNTCFMNSALQCLSNTPPLAEYFSSQSALKNLNPRSPSKGEVAVAFAELMGNMWSSSSSTSSAVERPSRLKSAVASVTRRFAGYEQHDAQEFLIALLDALHDDTNRVTAKLPFEELTDPPTASDKEISNDWWRYFTARNDSVVWNLFAGQLKSETRCRACGHRSRVFDPFMDLSVPIPKSECTLGDCLEKFVEPETIPGGEWRCSKCKEFQVAEKELAIFRLPQILVVHLKRFSMGSSSSSMFGGIFGGGGNKSKINTSVKFPTEGFDVKEYLALESPERSIGAATLYDLIGVVNHSGSLNGGHYVADCRNRHDKQWYHFNDSHVRGGAGKGSLSPSGAYILFFQRRGTRG
jgi:ubiquitin C-terminal hydrolase